MKHTYPEFLALRAEIDSNYNMGFMTPNKYYNQLISLSLKQVVRYDNLDPMTITDAELKELKLLLEIADPTIERQLILTKVNYHLEKKTAPVRHTDEG